MSETGSKREFIRGGAVLAGYAAVATLAGCGGASAATPTPNLEDLAARLATLEAESRIRLKLATYPRAFDRLDLALANTIYAPEATVDYGTNPSTGQVVFKGTGREAVEWLFNIDKGIAARGSQYLHYQNQAYIIINGDTAASEIYGGSVVLSKAADGTNTISYGLARYLDQWEKRNGEWLIVKRVVTSDGGWRVSTPNPITPTYNFALDQSDPSYAVLNSVKRPATS